MSAYRGVIVVYVDEHELGRGEVSDANIDAVLTALPDVALHTARGLVGSILKGYHAETVAAAIARQQVADDG